MTSPILNLGDFVIMTMTLEETSMIDDLWDNQGLNQYQIADKIGRSYITVSRYLGRTGRRKITNYRTRLCVGEINSKTHPYHAMAFWNRHSKGMEMDSDFTWDIEGFRRFVEYIGEIPEGMKSPSLGRRDHSIGYIKGNFFWQEVSDNSRESATRNGIFRKNSQNPEIVRKTQIAKAIGQCIKYHLDPTREEFEDWKVKKYFDSYEHFLKLLSIHKDKAA